MKTLPVSLFQVGLVHIVAISGVIYSGIVSYNKMTTGQCFVGTSCPHFLNVPVCYYGFFGFVLSFVLASTVFWLNIKSAHTAYFGFFWLTFLGSLFALYFLVYELFVLPIPSGARLFFHGYPSCLYGFILFGVLFFLVKSVSAHWREHSEEVKEKEEIKEE